MVAAVRIRGCALFRPSVTQKMTSSNTAVPMTSAPKADAGKHLYPGRLGQRLATWIWEEFSEHHRGRLTARRAAHYAVRLFIHAQRVAEDEIEYGRADKSPSICVTM